MNVPEVRDDEPAWPFDLYDRIAADREAGLRVLTLLFESPNWVHSVIQSIEYADDKTVRHRFTVDLTVPAHAPIVQILDAPPRRMLPIAFLPKGDVYSFSLEDTSGRPAPYLTRKHTEALSVGTMVAFTAGVVGGHIPGDIAWRIAGIIESPTMVAEAALEEWLEDAPLAPVFDRFGTGSKDNRTAVDEVLREFASSVMLIAITGRLPGERAAFSYSFESHFVLSWPSDRPNKFASHMGWIPITTGQRAAAAAVTTSYQLRASSPSGIDIVRAELFTTVNGRRRVLDRVRGVRSKVQLECRQATGFVQAEFDLQPGRGGWCRVLWFCAIATAVLLGLGWLRLPVVEHQPTNSHTDTVAILAALMLGVAGLIATVLARSAEHPLLSSLLGTLRKFAMVLGALPVVAAASLTLFPSLHPLLWTWLVLDWVAVALVLLFSVRYVVPKPLDERGSA